MIWIGKRYFLITKFSSADLWLKLLIFFLQHTFIYPLPSQGIKRAPAVFVRRLADCQLYDHSVNKVRNETIWFDVTSVQCDICLVPRLSPWLKVCSLVLSLARSKRCGVDHVRNSVHRKIDFWHACTLFVVIKKASLFFVAPLHRRCNLMGCLMGCPVFFFKLV